VINRGLLAKSIRETRWLIVACALALLLITIVLTVILPRIQEGLNEFLLQMPFVRTMLSSMTGVDAADGLTLSMLFGIVLTHPVVLAVTWALAIAMGTRFPAGEIDRGTIDVLLGWPVSRRAVYIAETIVWLAAGAVAISAGLLGFVIASHLAGIESPPALSRFALAEANLLAVYIAVGGLAMMCSSLSDRRGRAMAAVFALVVASFLLNFLAQYWEPAKAIKFLGLLEYYRPAIILRDGAIPWRDFVVLLGSTIITWTAGLEITARRSMCTV
jgi:ABC-type transport system involved in multi-copper enzyme maturation permease subunit